MRTGDGFLSYVLDQLGTLDSEDLTAWARRAIAAAERSASQKKPRRRPARL